MPTRLLSLDVYRGLTMLFMAFDGWRLAEPLWRLYPDSIIANTVAWHLSHASWRGCAVWDMIQPSFTFMVGVAMVFTLHKRQEAGYSPQKQWQLVIRRSLVLILLGVFLRSAWRTQTYWTFEDTLTQIGMGYPFLFWLSHYSARVQWTALGVVLFGYWLAFALWPVPEAFDYAAVGCPIERIPDFKLMTGFAAHWNPNSNLAWAFDNWWLNLFPREKPFVFNGGGYCTLSFIPTLGTQIVGLLAGNYLMRSQADHKLRNLLIAAAIAMIAATVLDITGICPSVKRIWTPSWVLWSGGCCVLAMVFFHWLIERKGYAGKWTFPMMVVGMNSIVFYCMSDSHFRGYVANSLKIHIGQGIFDIFGKDWNMLTEGLCCMLIFWLIVRWMWKRRIFVTV